MSGRLRPPNPLARAPTLELGVERKLGVDNVLRALGIERAATRCGRYELLDKLGEGGMGVVVSAHDPELDRAVAIKLLREATDEGARARLRREAHALARLSDPRVVTVFAVGETWGQTWIAMELVRGQTLAQWADATAADIAGRRPRALEILVAAGWGLAAAHTAGLSHRDFKPANVLLGDDGAVKIADFGLARSTERADTATDGGSGQSARLSGSVTAWAGTPRYMAPEQHEGLPADARSDQFAFAVTAWELLSGAPAFRAHTLPELVQAKRGGTVDRGAALPASVRRVLLRAMSPAPEDRFPDMAQLLQALTAKNSRRRWVLGLAAVCGAWAFVAWPAASPHPCAQLEPPGWGEDGRRALEMSLSRNGSRDVGEAWSKLEASIDGYSARWARERDVACASAPAEHRAVIAACLDGAARRFDDAIAIAVSDPGAALHGRRLVEALPSLECGAQDPRRPGEHRAIDAVLARADVLRAAGKYTDELAVLEPVEVMARDLADPRLLARVLVAIGDARSRGATEGAALLAIEEAHALAIAARDDELAMDAALSAVEVLLEHGDTPAAIDGWLEHARVAHERLGRPATDSAVWLLIHAAELARWVDSDPGRGLALAQEALALAETLDPETRPEVLVTRAAVHEVLADHYLTVADTTNAELHARLVLKWTTERLGADHPATKDKHSYLSDVLLAKGEYAEAMAALEIAFEGARSSFGHETSEIATLLVKLAVLHRFLDEPERALERAREALRIFEAIGASPMLLTQALAPLSTAQQDLGDLEAARATGERIIRTVEADLGPDHADLAPALYNLGDVLFELGRYDEAEARFRRSLDVAEASLGRESPNLAYPLSGLGEVAVVSGRHDDAQPLLARASRLAAEHHDARLVARIRWAQARALLDEAPAEAARLAGEARAAYSAAGADDVVAEIDASQIGITVPGR